MASLVDPLDLPSGVRLPNRIAKAALSEALGDADNSPDERIVTLYRRWAQGGYGLLVTGNIMVDRAHLAEPGNIAIEDDRALPRLTAWTKAAHGGGAAIFAQLNHPGRQSNLLVLGHTPVAPSPVPLAMPGATTPRELTPDELEEIIDRFATAAAVCEEAGFDGVELDAAHGYLITQFLSPLTNLRTDEWGGTAERRMRFLIEVVRRVRGRVSPGFAVAVKLNSADFQRGGFSEDDSRAVVAALAGEAVDLIEVSGGNYEAPAMGGSEASSTREREAYFLDYARSVRRESGGVPIAVTGGFRSRTAMDDALEAGDCDLVGIARPTVTATDAAASILEGRTTTLTTHEIQAGMRRILGRLTDLKALDGFLNISWSTDQLHRLARGLEPDLGRGALVTALAMVRRNGAGVVHTTSGLEMSRSAYDLTDKVVLITGGNSGIGAATTRILLDRGARVAVADIDPTTPGRAGELHPTNAFGCVADVRDRASLELAVAQTVDRFGRLDVVIANAGLLAKAATLRNTPTADIEATLAVNVTGVANTLAAALPQVIAHQGQVVLISSVFAFLNGMGTIPYAMSKAAVEQLGRGLRVELSDHGVSVLTAYFSLVQTDMIARGVDEDPVVMELLGALPKAMLKRITPAQAAAAIVDGLESRAARVIRPNLWRPVSSMRGLVGPALDSRFTQDRHILDVLARLDARPSTSPPATPAAPSRRKKS